MTDYYKLNSSANARVRDQEQMHLFQSSLGDLIKRWRVSFTSIESLFALDLLSFVPNQSMHLEPDQEAELTFLLSLRRAGFKDELMVSALSSLTKPYCYKVEQLLYDIHSRRWLARAPISARELTIEGRIKRAKEERDVRALKEIANEALKALVQITEELVQDQEQ